jgi:hypothetical protein
MNCLTQFLRQSSLRSKHAGTRVVGLRQNWPAARSGAMQKLHGLKTDAHGFFEAPSC